MKMGFKIFWLVFVFFALPFQVRGEELTVLTTTWIPYAYEKEGEIAGLSTEIIQATLNKAGLKGDIRLYSWNRAIITAKTQKNILIYPLMRIEQREKDFIWVSPVFEAKLALFKLKKNRDVSVRDLNDAQRYRTGVLKGAAMHQFLLSKGFEDSRHLHVSYANRKNIELLFRGRIDLVADNPLVVAYEIRQLARSNIKDVTFSMEEIQEVVPLTTKTAYMAFGKGSSPQYVHSLRTAWSQLKADGTLGRISARYR